MQNDLARLQRSTRDVARWRKAQEHLLRGSHGQALKLYRELTPQYPGIAELWFEQGNAAAGELDFAQANEAYRRVIQLSPGNASLLVMVGQQYQGLRQLDDARTCFERAVVADPASVDARVSLAVWFEKERRLDDAWTAVIDCLARHPRDDQARYLQAFLLHRKGRNAEAETALRDLIKDGPRYPYVKYAGPHLLGVVLDQMGQPAEAMRWLLEAKSQVRRLTDIGKLEQEYDKADAKRRELLGALTPGMIRRWRSEEPASDLGRRVAFLGGHPRSGTTLLEQVLDAHPGVLAFDEPVAFNQEVAPNAALPAAMGEIQAQVLDGLSAANRGQWRQRYVKSLLREVPDESGARLLVDKNPSPTMSLPIWLRVFPEIKVIIALRDPRDVLISCFFLNLMLNTSNANFLSLERTAKHYQDLMDVWLRMRELGGFDWLETRYEDMVNSVETEGTRVTGFLGLAWHPDQARYHETARRKFLFAPTYHDVTQPVYRRAIGRWEQYAEALEPLQARLAPYCRAFGYAT